MFYCVRVAVNVDVEFSSVFVGHVSDGVEDPVHLGAPAAVVSIVHLFTEVLQRLLLALLCNTQLLLDSLRALGIFLFQLRDKVSPPLSP